MSKQDLVCVGAVAGAYGVRGEVRLKSFCSDPAAIASYGPLFTADGGRRFDIKLVRQIPNGFAARLSNVASKDDADALRGTSLYLPRNLLPGLGDDEYYHADLIGLDVLDTGGRRLGEIRAIYNHGAGDLLEISGPDLKTALLLPFTRAIVPTVDLEAGRIIVDPPEGLQE